MLSQFSRNRKDLNGLIGWMWGSSYVQVLIDRVLLGSGTGTGTGTGTGRDGDKASCARICHNEEIWLIPFVTLFLSLYF